MKEKAVKRVRIIERRGTVKYLGERKGDGNLFNGKRNQVKLN